MKPRFTVLSVGLTLCLLLLVSLVLMSHATQNSAEFGRLYSPLLLLNTMGLVILVTLIGANIRRLIKQLRLGVPGSRLTLRMLILFVALAVTPVLVVYGFSLHFLQRGIDSWFDVKIEDAMKDALKLSRAALDLRMRELLRGTEQLADELIESRDPITPLDLDALRGPSSTVVLNTAIAEHINLDALRLRSGADELTLMTHKGQIITNSSTATDIRPNRPSDAVLLQVRQGRSHIGLDPIRDAGLYVRVVVRVPGSGSKPRLLQALYPITKRMNELADSVQSSVSKYTELAYLRKQLKLSFVMTLTLVLFFGILSTVWAALYSARRMAEPIRDLAEGTRAIARGEYNTQLPVLSQDEMGFLVESFNKMTRKIAIAQEQIRKSRDRVDAERAYLEAVLKRLSSGVITFDNKQCLRTANRSASDILDAPLEPLISEPVAEIHRTDHNILQSFFKAIEPHLSDPDWKEQILLFGNSGRRVLMCRGTALIDPAGQHSGHVIVFDDITAIIEGQRDAAWSEVARRLAHEIKNPLTPIKLSAERLRHRYLKLMTKQDSDTLNRLTNTIIQQVEIMKEMVNAFSEYARPPKVQPERVNLNKIVEEVLDLYRNMDPEARIITALAPDLPLIEADQGRLRQLLNNVIKNALEATDAGRETTIRVTTRYPAGAGNHNVELRIEDNGPGVPDDILADVFQPYVTTKPKGTGLGLAIVKKIVEEHGGTVSMENSPTGGASIVIQLPSVVPSVDALVQQKRKAI